MKRLPCALLITLLTFPFLRTIHAEPSISPLLHFLRNSGTQSIFKSAPSSNENYEPVTVRFNLIPDTTLIEECERHGLLFKRFNGKILHTHHIYPASIHLDSLDYFQKSDIIARIEKTFKPALTSTLDVSNPQVQASLLWDRTVNDTNIDGTGVIVANIDTGIDIYHPAFFKPDAGIYEWLDTNDNGIFDKGVDHVDINKNGSADNNEILNFYDAAFRDPLNLMERQENVYDADIDWLYNDINNNGVRDYGPSSGFSETDPSFGELIFVISDTNDNNLLDPGEKLTALGTSKILTIIDKKGIHHRGENLFTNTGDSHNHGTGSSGIIGGQTFGRRLTGMAPGVEFICINHTEVEVEENVLIAQELGADIFMYVFVSWVFQFLDGSSNLEIFISDLHKDNYPQFTASGNLAGPQRKKHALVSLEPRSEETISFRVPDIGIKNVIISILWFDKFFLPSITLNLSAVNSLQITGDQEYHQFGDIEVISGDDESPKGTKRMDIIITSEKSFSGDMSLVIQNKTRLSTHDIDAYIRDDVSDWMNGVQFQNFVTDDGTVCSPGTSENDITVGAYDPRGTRNEKGAINDFSSWGKTTDGRLAVDITAPGTLVYSLSAHKSGITQPGGYMDYGGTSSSLPHVVGCAALIKQVMPDITSDKMAYIIFNYAQVDEFTGPVPNDIWGYGKIRIYDTMTLSDLITPVQPHVQENDLPVEFVASNSYPNPFNSAVSFDIYPSKKSEYIHVTVYNLLGQSVSTKSFLSSDKSTSQFRWNGKDMQNNPLPSGIYLFQFLDGSTSITRRALLLR